MSAPHRLNGVYDAQCVDIHPETYEVSVALRHMGFFDGIKIALGGRRQHPVAGDFEMPEVGDWGIVAFTSDNPRSGIWLCSRPDKHRNMVPAELLKDDPKASLVHHPGDQYMVQHGDGSSELVWPDGTFAKVTTRKDGSLSNETARSELVERTYSTTSRFGEKGQRKPFEGRAQPPVDFSFEHALGFTFRITADGSLAIQTPKGHLLKVHDATEKVRSAEYPHDVQSTPEEDAQRVDSGITLETEKGHKIEVMDDPDKGMDARIVLTHKDGHVFRMKHGSSESIVDLTTNKGSKLEMKDTQMTHVKLSTAGGHKLDMVDTPTPSISLKTSGGHEAKLDDTAMTVELKTSGGASLKMSPAGTTVNDPLMVTVKSAMVNVEGSATTNIKGSALCTVDGGLVVLAGGGPNLVRTADLAVGALGPSVCVGTSRVLSG